MKIALLTLPLHANYGGVLQAFALKTVLERLGHEVWLVDNRRREKPVSNLFLKTVLRRAVESLFHRKEIFAELNTALTQDYKKSEIEKFIYRRLSPRTAPVYDADDYASIAADGGGYDLYIVGSDQVWRPRYAKELGPYFFSFLEGTAARRIAYAASFGAAECEYTREERERCARLLAEFEGVSVRERTGIGQCRDYFGRDDARQVLDPTLLLTAEDYRPLFIPGIAPAETIHCYLFRAGSAVRREIGRTAAARGLDDRPDERIGRQDAGNRAMALRAARRPLRGHRFVPRLRLLHSLPQALRRLYQPPPRLGAHPLASRTVRTRRADRVSRETARADARRPDRLGGGGTHAGRAPRRLARFPRPAPARGAAAECRRGGMNRPAAHSSTRRLISATVAPT